jgi:hypothetical protein
MCVRIHYKTAALQANIHEARRLIKNVMKQTALN